MAGPRALTVARPTGGWPASPRAARQRQSGLDIDEERTTRRYVIASQMITELGHAGSVLVVAGTRDQAQQLAQGLAAALGEQPALAPLVNFVRLQLGADHPLVAVLPHGVGFHHAGLPIEVLEALEQAVRDDTLPYLTCTSTLTDGVNLPVRTVIVYDQTYEGQDEDARLRGARLVNAMGRAGRAGKETEGWIVLVRAAEPTEADFRDLNPDAEALAVTSSLTTESGAPRVRRPRAGHARGRGRAVPLGRSRGQRLHQLRVAHAGHRGNFGALASELFCEALVVDHFGALEAVHHGSKEFVVFGAATEELLHFVDGVGAAHEGADGGFVQFRFGFYLAGFSKHGGRIEERKQRSKDGMRG